MGDFGSNIVLQRPPGTEEAIRKIHNLDKPGRLEEAINILHDWIQKQHHLTKKDFSKDYLEKTLISCKGSVEKAKKQIDRLCTFKTLMPRFFTCTDAKDLAYVSENAWMIPLPKLTPNFYRILLIKFRIKHLTAETIMDYFRYTVVVSEYLKANDYVNGFIIVDDYRETNLLDVITKMNPVDLQQYMSILMEGYGARIKGVHMLSDSKAVELIIKLMKQFVSEKIAKRMHVQKSLEDLHKYVPKDILPIEYGGSERSIVQIHDELVDAISSKKHVEYMEMMNKACTDESKRVAAKFNEEYLGMAGSFRNMSVD
ncbi:alpha-tocopherol transfer protein-like [Spodoptera frugiperda]|uniref:Alpha-tocopherol transfer protein-like n=1 Tax=Spodoptera frugiperda TaxID=7108 RepID=A0A9R0EQA6_SPOFR|nr:alpha-tocopherol transfer protein-like [Spodoptera frugiperda]